MRLFDRLLYAIEECHNPIIQTHLTNAINHMAKDEYQNARNEIELAYNKANFCEKSDLSRIYETTCELIPKGDEPWESFV